MKLFKVLGITLFAGMSLLSSCSDDIISSEETEAQSSAGTKSMDFVASLSPAQEENVKDSGEVYLSDQRKNSWNDLIDGDIPTCWGVFDSPMKQTKAVGIWGSYPAQYWTMIRVKIGELDNNIRDALNSAVEEIESKTNVRFYNSQYDDEYYEPYHIKLPNVLVHYAAANATEGSGSYGLIGGEQYIEVPRELANANYEDNERVRFFIHALCNAAGMFNEQQRTDRDNYVEIRLNNVKDSCRKLFDKQSKNYTMQGNFDYNSVTLASSTSYSKNGLSTIVKKGGGEIKRNYTLSTIDISFLNNFYLPYIARDDNYVELDATVYLNGRILSESERLAFQRDLNEQRGLYGEPPASGRKTRIPW